MLVGGDNQKRVTVKENDSFGGVVCITKCSRMDLGGDFETKIEKSCFMG